MKPEKKMEAQLVGDMVKITDLLTGQNDTISMLNSAVESLSVKLNDILSPGRSNHLIGVTDKTQEPMCSPISGNIINNTEIIAGIVNRLNLLTNSIEL